MVNIKIRSTSFLRGEKEAIHKHIIKLVLQNWNLLMQFCKIKKDGLIDL